MGDHTGRKKHILKVTERGNVFTPSSQQLPVHITHKLILRGSSRRGKNELRNCPERKYLCVFQGCPPPKKMRLESKGSNEDSGELFSSSEDTRHNSAEWLKRFVKRIHLNYGQGISKANLRKCWIFAFIQVSGKWWSLQNMPPFSVSWRSADGSLHTI